MAMMWSRAGAGVAVGTFGECEFGFGHMTEMRMRRRRYSTISMRWVLFWTVPDIAKRLR